MINLLASSNISQKRALVLKFEFECPGVTENDPDRLPTTLEVIRKVVENKKKSSEVFLFSLYDQ